MTSKWAKGGGLSGDECQNLVRVYRKARHPQSAEDPERWEPCKVAGKLPSGRFDHEDGRQGHVIAYTIAPEAGQGADLVAIPATVATGLSRTGLGRQTDRGTRIVQEESVRRLTPVEVERLFGFPDGWTCLCGRAARSGRYRSIDCACPDSPRYAALGNAVVMPVVEWIARRLKEALR